MADLLVGFVQELFAEVTVTILTVVVITTWHSLRKEPFEISRGYISRYDFLHWGFTLAALVGCAFVGWALLGNEGQTSWRILGNWLLYLLLSSGVLWISFRFLLHQKAQGRLIEFHQTLPGRNQIAQGTLAKAAAILLWIGVLAHFGPSHALLIWSLALGIAVDGYTLWRILKLD